MVLVLMLSSGSNLFRARINKYHKTYLIRLLHKTAHFSEKLPFRVKHIKMPACELVTEENVQRLLDSVDTVLTDCDGWFA